MCGIIGALGTIPEKRIFEKARDTLRHRGPNDRGTYYDNDERVALGHRRLSIIDLSKAGHQPFFSNDERFVITFNGEIYNYIEIKEELKNHYAFKTKTDTEVILASYIYWGEKCVEHFNGMFALAIWDKKERKLFCARDRLGIKPFFYSVTKSTFLFSSEIKALLALGAPCSQNERVIFEYLYYGIYDHGENTFFKQVMRLPAGAILSWKDGVITIKKYWDLAKTEPISAHLSDKEVRQRFTELLIDSINLRFRSDVPVGIGLSSGLDSQTLYHFAKNVLGKKMTIFSECTASNEYNECDLVGESLSAKEKKNWYTSFFNQRDIFTGAHLLNSIQDQPYGGVPSIASANRFRCIRKNKTIVLLEGEGLDDLLGGYKYYTLDLERDERGATHTPSSLEYSQDMTSLVPRNILSKTFVNSHVGRQLIFPEPFKSHLLNAQYRDIVYTKIPRTLRFKDHTSMAYGTEVRMPFLDYRIVEFCFFLPPRYKIHNGVQKTLVREIMQKHVPHSVLERPKKSFGAIQTEWFRKYFRQQIYSLVTSSSFKKRGYWNNKELAKEISAFHEGKGGNSFFIWQCINLELWFRKFITTSEGQNETAF